MKEELGEGRFSADGSYVANSVDPLAKNDVWLDGLSKKAIREAKEAKDRMDAKQKQREEEENKNEEQLTQLRDDCLIGLLSLVRPGETVARALTRLGNAKKRVETSSSSTSTSTSAAAAAESDAMDVDSSSSAPTSLTPPQRYAKKINSLTHLASTLLSSHGELEIYDQTYEEIIKTLRSEGAVRRDWVPPTDPDIALEEKEEWEAKEATRKEKEEARAASGAAPGRSRVVIARPGAGQAPSPPQGGRFVYKWNPAPPGQPEGQENGPYGRAEMEGWIAGGFFGAVDEAERILVKREGENEWTRWREVR
jgi:CD2 antigen cytoplasmic tail-binding protein 2